MTLTDSAAQLAAQDRAELVLSERNARRMFKRAVQSGDTYFRDAILRQAKLNGWDVVPNVDEVAQDVDDRTRELVRDFAQTTDHLVGLRIAGHVSAQLALERFAALAKSSGWAAKLDGITRDGTQPSRDAAANLTAQIAGLTATGRADDPMVVEIRTGRAWDRLKAVLDRASESALISVAAGRLGSAADPYELRAAVAELPTYLELRGFEEADDMVRAILQQTSPDVATAVRDQRRADRLRDVVNHNDSAVRHLISTLPNRTGIAVLGPESGYVDPSSIAY